MVIIHLSVRVEVDLAPGIVLGYPLGTDFQFWDSSSLSDHFYSPHTLRLGRE
jgi:hypothetical protein